MTELLKMREKIVHITKEYETWFLIIAKFVGMFFVFNYVNGALGYYELFNHQIINLFMALVCSILPGSIGVLVVAAVVALHMLKLSVVLAGIVLLGMVLAYLLFIRFAPEQSVLLLIIPVCMQYNLHFMIPVIAGMFFTPYAIVPIVLGMVMVKFIGYTVAAAALTGTGTSIQIEGIIAGLIQIIDQLTGDKEVILFAFITMITLAVVYVIGQFSFDYAWYVAIAAGALVEIVAGFAGSILLKTEVNLLFIIIGALAGGVIAALMQFFKCTVDYAHKEFLQFEDENYYYYVKAIPKYKFHTDYKTRRKSAKEEESPEVEQQEEAAMESEQIEFFE